MISFVTLFIGLVLGVQQVEVAVDPRVDRVELRLDGELVGRIDGPPWRTPIDLTARMIPRELVAEAFDAEGESLGTARQWLNLPRPDAEVSLVLENGDNGMPMRARLAWESLAGGNPRNVTATLDGRPLAVTNTRLLDLPPLDPAELHYLRVEVEFNDAISAISERVFGGTYTDTVTTELSVVPVLLTKSSERPKLDELQGRLQRAGATVEVTAVERGPAQIIVVRDEAALLGFDRIQRDLTGMMRVLGNAQGLETSSAMLREAFPLEKDHQLRFLLPHSEAQEGASLSYQLFPSSPQFIDRDGGLYWLLSRSRARRRVRQPQRLADAVAVAGMSAAGEGRRRVVLLVLGRKPEDESVLPAPTVRQFLASVRVPLRVWTLDPRAATEPSPWGEATDVSTAARLGNAASELMDLLDRQLMVWVRGTYRPQDLEASPEAPFTMVQ